MGVGSCFLATVLLAVVGVATWLADFNPGDLTPDLVACLVVITVSG